MDTKALECGHTMAEPVMSRDLPEALLLRWYCPDCDQTMEPGWIPPAARDEPKPVKQPAAVKARVPAQRPRTAPKTRARPAPIRQPRKQPAKQGDFIGSGAVLVTILLAAAAVAFWPLMVWHGPLSNGHYMFTTTGWVVEGIWLTVIAAITVLMKIGSRKTRS